MEEKKRYFLLCDLEMKISEFKPVVKALGAF